MAVLSAIAKVQVTSLTRTLWNKSAETVEMQAVGDQEWSKFTPDGSIKLSITNDELTGKFELGGEYLVHFEPVPDAE